MQPLDELDTATLSCSSDEERRKQMLSAAPRTDPILSHEGCFDRAESCREQLHSRRSCQSPACTCMDHYGGLGKMELYHSAESLPNGRFSDIAQGCLAFAQASLRRIEYRDVLSSASKARRLCFELLYIDFSTGKPPHTSAPHH